MVRRFIALVLMLAFGLAPLAQAVDCVMGQPAAEDCHMSQAPQHDPMTVGDCFTALKAGVMPGVVTPPPHDLDDMALLPVFPVVEKPALVIAAITPVRDRLLHAPPDDIILLTARRRI